MEKEFEGKVSLVTGASRGIGKAITVKLASLGCKVAVNYRSNDEQAAKVISEIESAGGRAMLAKCDIADSGAVKAMFKDIVAKWEKVDILVNNAGIVKDNLLLRMRDADWDDVLNTNLKGAYLCTKFALRTMMDNNWGRVINISSLAGIVGNMGQANYSASKGGLIAFTKAVAREVGARNITSNVICPGYIVTEMTGSAFPEEVQKELLARIPLQRFGTPDDIANTIAFLASDSASYLTAQVISIDGGII
ncbi:MAG: 3-oxoacyl-[acyl-carrier-protein] reductase [Chloroflexi bacterium]|jgi:3-oxoacyl-[acyl-carrier protein] reductase|nr:3-oxoacyl-[acyl-carrier-protein] reductase [Chloroflexota bacterium]MBT7082240.1 3-oxoacyl-[acyl-carrier-protein] reductase [Chloroflexota bacterium]MBT7289531.1 3-oxoacyl-[acyl-carrier-protein] reductase [Chloroflexota bacterium]